jgi:hypothetical protein
VNTAMNLRVPYKVGISWLAESLSASQEAFCSMELITTHNGDLFFTYVVNTDTVCYPETSDALHSCRTRWCITTPVSTTLQSQNARNNSWFQQLSHTCKHIASTSWIPVNDMPHTTQHIRDMCTRYLILSDILITFPPTQQATAIYKNILLCPSWS